MFSGLAIHILCSQLTSWNVFPNLRASSYFSDIFGYVRVVFENQVQVQILAHPGQKSQAFESEKVRSLPTKCLKGSSWYSQASPKSVNLASRFVRSMIMFSGLISRCRIPCSSHCIVASRICLKNRRPSSSIIPSPASITSNKSIETSGRSSTKTKLSLCWKMSSSPMTFGWRMCRW